MAMAVNMPQAAAVTSTTMQTLGAIEARAMETLENISTKINHIPLSIVYNLPTTLASSEHVEICLEFVAQYTKPLGYALLTLVIVSCIGISKTTAVRKTQACSPKVASSVPQRLVAKKQISFKASARPPGVWFPSEWKRPAPRPLPDWNVHTTAPLPYRPFKYGNYHITMGLRSMPWDDWIELDNHYLKYHADKNRRILERGDRCCRTSPEGMDGAIELLEELCDYLPQRYPTLFSKTATGITNHATDETFNIVQRPLAEDPMRTCARLVQDDLAIMFERPDGQYYFLAGAILLAGFWRLEDKFGMCLSDIHTSGDVPGYKTKLERGMMNFFRRVQPDAPVVRNNYFIQVDDELAWSSSVGPEDFHAGQIVGLSTVEKNKAIHHHHFRSERQSFRRLPRSGGVVFTIRTYFEPITKIAQEPGVPGRLASGVRSWGEDTSKYKGKDRYAEVLLEYLDAEHRKQVAAGLCAEVQDEDDRAAYPF